MSDFALLVSFFPSAASCSTYTHSNTDHTSWRRSCSGASRAVAWRVGGLVGIGNALACVARGRTCVHDLVNVYARWNVLMALCAATIFMLHDNIVVGGEQATFLHI